MEEYLEPSNYATSYTLGFSSGLYQGDVSDGIILPAADAGIRGYLLNDTPNPAPDGIELALATTHVISKVIVYYVTERVASGIYTPDAVEVTIEGVTYSQNTSVSDPVLGLVGSWSPQSEVRSCTILIPTIVTDLIVYGFTKGYTASTSWTMITEIGVYELI